LEIPYYIAPQGETGRQAFGVIHAAIIVLAEPRGKGMPGAIRYPYEIRKEADYFGDIPDEKIPKQMLDLAVHVVEGWA
jgi:DNA end-binding protein Ku